MKTASALLIAALSALKLIVLPDMVLLGWIIVSISIDLITGLMKAYALKQARTSNAFRKTVTKLGQYGGVIIVAIILSNLPEQKGHMANLVHFLADGVLIFIIYIETLSICENLYAMNPQSMFARHVIKNIISILTFQLKNNPTVKALEELKDTAPKVLVIAMMLGIAGCAAKPIEECKPRHKKKAEKLLMKSLGKCPAVERDYAAKTWPHIESTNDSTQTETEEVITPGAEIDVNCDSLLKAMAANGVATGSVKVKCPPCTSTITTIHKQTWHTIRNRAEEQRLNDSLVLLGKRLSAERDAAAKKEAALSAKVEDLKESKKDWVYAAIGTWVFIVIVLVLGLFNKFKLRTLI